MNPEQIQEKFAAAFPDHAELVTREWCEAMGGETHRQCGPDCYTLNHCRVIIDICPVTECATRVLFYVGQTMCIKKNPKRLVVLMAQILTESK